jgi:exosortase
MNNSSKTCPPFLRRNRQNIMAIILAGSRNFGWSQLHTQLPVSLWPVGEKSVLRHLLDHLERQGITKVVVCSNGDASLLRESCHLNNHYNLELKFLDEPLPMGTAGCIRKAADDGEKRLFIVFTAAVVSPPDIDYLLQAHNEGGSNLTVFFNSGQNGNQRYGRPADIYVCDRSVLRHIPPDGYFDIKQGVIPAMIGAGETASAATLPNDVGNFLDWQGYLSAVSNYLQRTTGPIGNLNMIQKNNDRIIWKGSNVNIHSAARILGRVVILDGASIAEGAVIAGQTIIGRNVSIGADSVIINSIIWDDSKVENNCLVRNCIIDRSALLQSNTTFEEEAVASQQKGLLRPWFSAGYGAGGKTSRKIGTILKSQWERLGTLLSVPAQPRSFNILTIIALIILLLSFFWSYRSGIEDLWNVWNRSDEYSSGLLVPFLALYVLWARRETIAQCPIQPSMWGILAFIFAQGVRLFGLYFMYSSLERLSIVLSVCSLVWLFCGGKFFKKVSTVLLFLCLMLPWPHMVQSAVALPLQRWATSSAVFCLELIGYEVIQEGNIISIGQSSVAVAEACNGLRMITAFFVIGAWVVLLVKRKWWEKMVVLVSCLPIALLCNTIRLTITAIAFTVITGERWEKIFHDFGGYAMMPLALCAIVAELWLLSILTAPPAKKDLVVIERK